MVRTLYEVKDTELAFSHIYGEDEVQCSIGPVDEADVILLPRSDSVDSSKREKTPV